LSALNPPLDSEKLLRILERFQSFRKKFMKLELKNFGGREYDGEVRWVRGLLKKKERRGDYKAEERRELGGRWMVDMVKEVVGEVWSTEYGRMEWEEEEGESEFGEVERESDDYDEYEE
jgi:hypothetical protein